MTQPLWGRCLRQAPEFPARLDDEHSFLSVNLRLPMNKIAMVQECRPARLRIVFRRDYPQHRLSRRQQMLNARIEVFDIPATVRDDTEIPFQQSLIERIRQEAILAGLSLDLTDLELPQIICNQAMLAPDPGELPGHLVIDATLVGASFHNLDQASNHRLVALLGRGDVELLRLPPETSS